MKRFSDYSLKIKLLSIVLFNSITIIGCTIFGYRLYTRAYNTLLFQSVASNLSTTAGQISDTMESIEYISSLMLSSSVIQNTLGNPPDPQDSLAVAEYSRVLNNALQEYAPLFHASGILYATLYDSQFTNSTNWALLAKTPDFLLETALKNGEERQGAVTWTYSFRQPYMLLSRNIRQIENLSLKPIGNLVIGADIGRIVLNSTRSISTFQNQSFILADQEGQILYASPSLSDEDARFFLSRMPDSYDTVSYGDHDFFAVGGTLPHYSYQYISLVPFGDISQAIKVTFSLIAFIFAVGFSLILWLSTRLIKGIIAQFDSLIQKMERFTENELVLSDEDSSYCSQNNEVGALHRQFTRMAHRIQNLVEVNYVNEILAREAQLKALKSQISPHFLYNTLETINWRAKAAGDPAISQMVEALGALLRASLSNKRPLVSIAYELELVQSYITIQKIRFEDRLAYEVEVDEAAKDGAIPPLTLQPLIENAIRYGMEEMIEVCHIFLLVKLTGSLLSIQVKNEGSAFDDGLLDKLYSGQREPHGFGIGLLNIDQRIKLLFGKEYGLSLSNEQGFAVAAITMPYQKEGFEHVEITDRR